MAALGVDRWAAVTFPLTYASRVRHKHAALTAAYAWVDSLALSTVPTLFAWTDYSSVYASCTVHLQQMEPGFALFTVGFHCASFALTLLVLSVTYMKVLIVARLHCKRIDVITVQTLLVLVDIHPRLAELIPSVRINPHWGVISKCLVYSKAAMDPCYGKIAERQLLE